MQQVRWRRQVPPRCVHDNERFLALLRRLGRRSFGPGVRLSGTFGACLVLRRMLVCPPEQRRHVDDYSCRSDTLSPGEWQGGNTCPYAIKGVVVTGKAASRWSL